MIFVCGSNYHVTSLAKLLCIVLWDTLMVSTTVLQRLGDFDLVHEFSEAGFSLESVRVPSSLPSTHDNVPYTEELYLWST